MSDSEKPEVSSKPKRDPAALSSEYHKARKQLMLWAAILFVWELVGIDLDKAKEAGGNAGAIIGAIRSPRAVPWALVILVFYFSFKLRVEWRQCNEDRRGVREARQDYLSAFIVASLACGLYFVQTISRVQLADYLPAAGGGGLELMMFLFTVGGPLVFYGVQDLARWRQTGRLRSRRRLYSAVFSILAFIVGALLMALQRFSWKIGIPLIFVMVILFAVEFANKTRPLPKSA